MVGASGGADHWGGILGTAGISAWGVTAELRVCRGELVAAGFCACHGAFGVLVGFRVNHGGGGG
ncbi:MAG: hypothetical protein PHE53_08670, partial [Thermoguttaceae bacterium]|nr:hypothetical protein [Thermoguttaceae bacterium]